jgi:hypothetical protein
MDWQDQLIALYLFIGKHYQRELWSYCQRMTNGAHLHFTDEEAITLYLFGVMKGWRTYKVIYTYGQEILKDWFPRLPG